ncbi:MAG: hypothetical protein HY221_01765 [Candidatus Sungbacteria bacterium]|uniref:Uncharacterized protein n=1 Tax=Candidatus Sungiibacteriota bacterium TaxID=2750080 RepID=A0A932QY87_9BACT|nr:hypothetical protein [Candidatus Sungbacteria bacterium]
MMRFIWKILCIPLEIFRAFLMAFTQLFCLLTHRNATRILAVFWIIGFLGFIRLEGDDEQIFTVQFILPVGLVMLVLNALNPYFWRSLRKMQTQTPLWRLKAPAIVRKPQFASVVMTANAAAGEHRKRMVSRLSPELQSMLAAQK